MLDQRDSNGNWIPSPDKFPSGLASTVAFINSLGLKMGLYTARSTHTCAGFMGSCGFEATDAAWLAANGISYLKDDNCGGCSDYLTDYGKMQQGIWATGKPLVLTVEGDPAVQNMTHGGFGNAKRVGHDIIPTWRSAISLVDIGSGLWPYAHGILSDGTPAFWTDLDMIEIGNGEFSIDSYPAGSNTSLILSQAHYSLWAIMKAVMLLGNDLTQLDPQTLAILTNKDALAVSQDPLGVQGRRVKVVKPQNNTFMATQWDSAGVIAKCDATSPTQKWFFTNTTSPTKNLLYVYPCNANDPTQQWNFAGSDGTPSFLQNKGTNQCVDTVQFDPAILLDCSASKPSQMWAWNSSTGHIAGQGTACLDLFDFTGPDVEIGYCKVPGNQDQNQQWMWNAQTGQIQTNTTGGTHGWCLGAGQGPAGGSLSVVVDGTEWCLVGGGAEGNWYAQPCDKSNHQQTWLPMPVNGQPGNFTFNSGSSIGWNGQFGASGPFPHSRYLTSGNNVFTVDLEALTNGTGAQIFAASNDIIDDDCVGNVTTSGGFCMDMQTMGWLETWAGPLSNDRFAVVLFNRSPADEAMTLDWSDLGVASGNQYAVRDIWQASNVGTFSGSYTTTVPSHGVAFLILTPA
jgi:alpha-galactosidase